MATDYFEEAIVARLEGEVDRDRFEECANALLRDVYPSLAPLPGGSDAGVDGVTAGEGPFLVATTGARPVRNLESSLKAHLARGEDDRRSIIFATPRRLTAATVRKLHQRADALGFKIENVYQQQAFVERLYHDPHWCKKLLDLNGNPPALALVPRGHRPLIEGPLLGQERALEWVRATGGDRVLSGPPGSGKTYLLFHLAREGYGFFLESNDPGRIADDLRRLQPKVVFVDDSHVRREDLRTLRDLRKQLGFAFDIVATTWEGEDRQDVLEELSLPESQALSLPRLSRKQILEIIQRVGINGPPRLLREILDQADRRPGLAVTLAHLCLHGGAREIALGNALSRTLLQQLRERLGHQAADILAVLALGGKSGVAIRTVADFLGLSVSDVRNVLAHLATAGVIVPAGDRVAVRPPTLRFALVRDRFLDETQPNFNFRDLLPPDSPEAGDAAALHFEEGLLTLLGAVHRGGKIPRDEIERRLPGVTSREAWSAYAALGLHEASWVLENFSDVTAIADGCLAGNPALAIRRLLDSATGDQRELDSHPRQPLRILRDWLTDLELAQVNPDGWLERRRQLVDAAIAWVDEGGDKQTGLAAVWLAMSPTVSGTSADPVSGMTITISQGIASTAALNEIETIWPRVLELLDTLKWSMVDRVLHQWVYPDSAMLGTPVDDQKREHMHTFARRMVSDLAARFGDHPGLGRRLQEYADVVGVEVAVSKDGLFELLCPRRSEWRGGDFQTLREQHQEKVKAGASDWAASEPEVVARALVTVSQMAKEAGLHFDNWSYLFCSTLAEISRFAPSAHVEALLRLQAEPHLIDAFMERLRELGATEVLELATTCLRTSPYEHLGFTAVITHPSPPPELLEEALKKAERHVGSVEACCMRRQVPIPTLLVLLQHPDPSVALAAASGEWHKRDSDGLRDEVLAPWREAVLRVPLEDETPARRMDGQEWELGQILASDPELAYEWFARQLTSGRRSHWCISLDPNGAVVHGLTCLATAQRVALLELVPNDWAWVDFVRALVGSDLDAYAALLANESKRDLWGGPLRHGAGVGWAEKAGLALRAGLLAAEIVEETLFGGGWTTTGSGLDHWREELAKIEQAAADRPELSDVVAKAHEVVAPLIERATQREEHLEAFGSYGED